MVPVIIAAILLILDQAMKFFANHFIELDTGVKSIIPGVLQMVNLRNDGSALAFITGNKVILLAALVLVTVIVVVLVARVLQSDLARSGLLILLVGLLGNGADLLIFGYVTDMLELHFLPNIIFNLADVLLGLGAVLFAVGMFTGGGRYEDDDDDDEEYEDEDEEDERPRRGLFGKRRDDEDEDEDEEYEDEDDEEDERPRRGLFGKRNRDYEEDEDEEDEEPVRKTPVRKPSAPATPVKKAAPVQKAPASAKKPAAPVQKSAAPVQKIAAEKPAAPVKKSAAPVQKAPASVKKAAPAPVKKAPAPVQKNPEPSVSDDEFDLDSILNEFK